MRAASRGKRLTTDRSSVQIAQRGMIALALAQSPEFVAPFGAAAALYGTNPIGAPSLAFAL